MQPHIHATIHMFIEHLLCRHRGFSSEKNESLCPLGVYILLRKGRKKIEYLLAVSMICDMC